MRSLQVQTLPIAAPTVDRANCITFESFKSPRSALKSPSIGGALQHRNASRLGLGSLSHAVNARQRQLTDAAPRHPLLAASTLA